MEGDGAIWVAGQDTLVGRSLQRQLLDSGRAALPAGPDLRDAPAVAAFLRANRPERIWLVGGRSGGILANQRFPADLMIDNLLSVTHVLEEAARLRVPRLLYLASACIYPRIAPQPLRPGSLFSGPLEPTNEAYATARLAGLVLCRAVRQQHGLGWVSAIPAVPYGPHDHFDPEEGHVIPSLLRRFHEARRQGAPEVVLWGTGAARRDFVYVDDLADACIHLLDRWDGDEPVNVGSGSEVSILDLARKVRDVVGFAGDIGLDPTRPDGMPLKALDAEPLLALGWRPRVDLEEGLRRTYAWFLAQGD